MAIVGTRIAAVRVGAPDGSTSEYGWNQDAWYTIRDDCPYLDLLVEGHDLSAVDPKWKFQTLGQPEPGGARWQRWDLQVELSNNRRCGQIELQMRVPKHAALRCYVVPTRLIDVQDVLIIVEQIENETGREVGWELGKKRTGRAWSRTEVANNVSAQEFADQIQEEMTAARSIRHDPFCELGPDARGGMSLAENAIVSRWATMRHAQMEDACLRLGKALEYRQRQRSLSMSDGRRERLNEEIESLHAELNGLERVQFLVAQFVVQAELSVPFAVGPVFLRDHRLRRLLRAFVPPTREMISAFEAPLSRYPPILFNKLWEVWGAVWLVRFFRAIGFEVEYRGSEARSLEFCSWKLRRGNVLVEIDYEPGPVLVDQSTLPPAHQRSLPALEWAAERQAYEPVRPFLGLQDRCAPDYLVRITTPKNRVLLVGDGCLATPEHHGTGKAEPKPRVVEHYRQTIGWIVGNEVVRCHPMGGFVVFPPPTSAWAPFERIREASDCTILCPSPKRDVECADRLINLLRAVAPEIL